MDVTWSSPHTYDLTRTPKRVSVPKALEDSVPECAGTYVIFRTDTHDVAQSVIDIGECGPRENSKPCGLRGRLASNVAHSASARIANDISGGRLQRVLSVVWVECASKKVAKDTQDALLVLFAREFGQQPKYNARIEHCQRPDRLMSTYESLKRVIHDTSSPV